MGQDGTRSTGENEPDSAQDSSRVAGSDEVYCTSCGTPIKKEAEICPECGVSQKESEESSDNGESRGVARQTQKSISDRRQYELERIASKSTTNVMLWGLFVTPVAYLKLGKTGWALLNFFTANYLLLGFLLVPLHARKMIKDARTELRRADVAGY